MYTEELFQTFPISKIDVIYSDLFVLNDGNLLGDEVECVDTEEDEYDALNDETFGGLGDSSALDDWERQHEQLAEIAESTKHTEHIENSISQLVLDDSDDGLPSAKDYADWSCLSGRNGDIFNSSLLTSLQKTVSTSTPFIEPPKILTPNKPAPMLPPPVSVKNQIPSKICTVEELERVLRHQKNNVVPPPPHPQNMPPNLPPPGPPMFMQPPQGMAHMPPRLPPGLHHPMGIPPPGIRQMPPGFNPNNLPPPHFRMPPHPPPNFGLMYPPNNNMQFPMNQFNFPPPPRNMNPPNMQQVVRHQQQNNRNINNNNSRMERHKPEHVENKDEYVGLMTHREKQWLLNIQQVQLNTGTPYFDDYYYTVFKERKARNNKENQPNAERNQRFQRHNHHRNQDRQENTLTTRVFTPLQFENSLGKLQWGSVTAPRKIIDMDVVTLEKDTESTPTRDTRKTKQLLLELEGLYSLFLKAEDLRNPVAIANMEKLYELKQKQRLRELDAAVTPEMKQEILMLLQTESVPPQENQVDQLTKIITNFLQDDKFNSYMNIRKGKMLLLRLLPHLTAESFTNIFNDLWMKVLLSLPLIGRRDTVGDNILPRLHPYFKRYIQSSKMSDILDITSNLIEVPKMLENSRSTPLSHQGRNPLYFVVSNKFGVSALCTLLIRTEYLLSSDNVSEQQLKEWAGFVSCWSDLSTGKPPVAAPIELIPWQTFTKHMNRIPSLPQDKKKLLEKHYVDTN